MITVTIKPLQFIKIPHKKEKETLYYITGKKFEFDKIEPDLEELQPYKVSKEDFNTIHRLWDKQKEHKAAIALLSKDINKRLNKCRSKEKKNQ